MELFIVLILLFLLTVYSLYHAFKVRKNGGYFLASISLISLLAIYCVGVLGYRVSGQTVGLEKKVEKITDKQEQLNEIVQILVKMVYIAQDQALLIGNPPQYTEELEKCKNELKDYLGENFNEDLDNLLKSLEPPKP